MDTRTWLITGASSGLGRALAEHVLARGDRAVVTASTLDATSELASRYPDTALAVRLDVTDGRQRESGVREALTRFGAVALTRLVLPGMRERRRGTIVNVSSMDGLASLPANGYYSAGKFALEGFTEAL
jgi:NADP-dependent 3-hydroxy acid dehydrogenase YdfG